MANEGEFPKDDGDVFYGKDANIMHYNALNSNILNYDAVSVGSDATAISLANNNRKIIFIRNNGSISLYLGDNSVAVGSGYELAPGKYRELYTQDDIYGICNAGIVDTRYIEVE